MNENRVICKWILNFVRIYLVRIIGESWNKIALNRMVSFFKLFEWEILTFDRGCFEWNALGVQNNCGLQILLLVPRFSTAYCQMLKYVESLIKFSYNNQSHNIGIIAQIYVCYFHEIENRNYSKMIKSTYSHFITIQAEWEKLAALEECIQLNQSPCSSKKIN